MTNEEFEQLSPAAKRVAIARDVIAAIKAERLVPMNMTYLSINGESPNWRADPNKQIRDFFVPDSVCQVCALGALFYAAVTRHDALVAGAMRGAPAAFSYRNYLEQFFELDALEEMEKAFEKWGEWQHAGADIRDPEERLLFIMQDLADNDGEFTLTPETWR